jgi:hypothetical protein
MSANPEPLSCEVDVQPGQRLKLPESLVEQVGPGHWIVIVQPAASTPAPSVRVHSAFLAGYAECDEGLYDDYTGG